MFSQEKGQPDGFKTQILPHRWFGTAAVVTLIKKEVDRLVDGLHTLGYFRSVGNFYKRTRKTEELPCPAESFFDGVLAGQEGIGDLRNAEAAERFQYERDLGFD